MNEIEKIKDAISFINQWKQVWISEIAKEYMDTAIRAMQEKIERENPQEDCKYCNGKNYRERELIPLYQSHDFAEIVIDADNTLYISNEDIDLSISTAEISYCPMCGRKLTKHIGEATNVVEGE